MQTKSGNPSGCKYLEIPKLARTIPLFKCENVFIGTYKRGSGFIEKYADNKRPCFIAYINKNYIHHCNIMPTDHAYSMLIDAMQMWIIDGFYIVSDDLETFLVFILVQNDIDHLCLLGKLDHNCIAYDECIKEFRNLSDTICSK